MLMLLRMSYTLGVLIGHIDVQCESSCFCIQLNNEHGQAHVLMERRTFSKLQNAKFQQSGSF